MPSANVIYGRSLEVLLKVEALALVDEETADGAAPVLGPMVFH